MSKPQNKKTKICSKCKTKKALEDFHKSAASPDGHRPECKICNRAGWKEYAKKNKEKIKKRRYSFKNQYNDQLYYAKRRGYKFLLNEKVAKKNFFNTNCYYCKDKFEGLRIDRVDNSVGYIEKNCVPCCKTCNLMKLTLDKSEWYNHMKKVLKNVGEI